MHSNQNGLKEGTSTLLLDVLTTQFIFCVQCQHPIQYSFSMFNFLVNSPFFSVLLPYLFCYFSFPMYMLVLYSIFKAIFTGVSSGLPALIAIKWKVSFSGFLQHFHFQDVIYCIHIKLLPSPKSTCVCFVFGQRWHKLCSNPFSFILHSPMCWKAFTRKVWGGTREAMSV